MCGIFGVFGHKEAANLTYLGLYALQHRGQESAGIVSSDGMRVYRHAGMGLVSDVFTKDVLKTLKGNLAIGHVRYSTSGVSDAINMQPIVMNLVTGPVAIAHNGNLINIKTLKHNLVKNGAKFRTSTDSEIILQLIAQSPEKDIETKIIDALKSVEGAYSVIFLAGERIIAVRDQFGFRPLSLGRLKNSYVVASETCAFDLIGAKYLRDIQPGELVSITNSGINTIKFAESKKRAFCIFEFIYFSRPDSKVFGNSVYRVRRQFGCQLAKESKVKADIVISVPDSANVQAVGYAEEAKLPYEIGFIRNHYIGRTFIEPKQAIRDFRARIKYNPVPETLKGKDIVVVDDSIVRGTTSKKLVKMLKKAGAKKIHHRISSPPIKYSCFYGIDTPTRRELIAARKSIEGIRKFIGVSTLKYLSISGLIKATGMKKENFCLACFNGKYPIRKIE